MTARILLADDHDVVRRGVRALLETQPDWEVVGEAATGRDAVEKARDLKPDLVVLDITMPELNGFEAARRILDVSPRTEVLVFTMHESEQMLGEMLDAGARGFVLKSDAGRDLLAAVEALLQHRPFFTSRVSEMVLRGYLRKDPGGEGKPSPERPRNRLTPREREIVQLLAEGKNNREVASVLGISVKTAETHRTNVMRKLDLHSVGELVRYAIRNRIIQP